MRIQRLLLACAGALAIAACSGQGATNSLLPNGPGSSAPAFPGFPTADKNVRASCAPGGQGFAQCFALFRTDVFYKVAPAYAAMRLPAGTDVRALTSSNYFYPLDPAHIRTAYNLPSTTKGSGQVVGIVDAFNDPNAATDLAKYRSQFGLGACAVATGCLKILNQLGKTSPLPTSNAGWAQEISLDLDMVSAVCPLCHIVLIEANSASFSDLGIAEGAAKTAGAKQISNSFGGLEYTSADAHFNLSGVTLTASAGDHSFNAGPQAPCVYSTVVCVGGTSIFPYNNTRGWLETAWSGSGSGCSKFVTKPTWIPTANNCDGTNKRAESDISAVADPYTGVYVYDSYGVTAGYYVFGGTSVSSPIIASIYALSGHGSTDLNAKSIWTAAAAHSTALTDVTIGNNGQSGILNAEGQDCHSFQYICYAGVGYDGPTGNGTPYGTGAF